MKKKQKQNNNAVRVDVVVVVVSYWNSTTLNKNYVKKTRYKALKKQFTEVLQSLKRWTETLQGLGQN